MKNNPLVTIIIPVYNAAASLSVALTALHKQQYCHLEIVLIDDGSQDNSLMVIETFISKLEQRDMNVKVIRHEGNQGVAAARNTGLENATGDFIYFLDADDWLEPDAIASLLQAAIGKQADIVGCNWFLAFKHNERRMDQPAFSASWQAINAMLRGTMRWNLWLFLVRRSLYMDHQIRFTPGMDMGEDLMIMMKLFVRAERVAHVDKPLYHYVQTNEQSLTKLYSNEHISQVTTNVKAVECQLLDSPYASQLGNGLNYLKLNIKLPLLISDQEAQYRRWLNWFPEANGQVMENKALPFRTRMIQWLAVKEQFLGLKLYYRFVIKFVYGVIYK
jgi:glycosyltransferase involved in cell wall biosynthesis